MKFLINIMFGAFGYFIGRSIAEVSESLNELYYISRIISSREGIQHAGFVALDPNGNIIFIENINKATVFTFLQAKQITKGLELLYKAERQPYSLLLAPQSKELFLLKETGGYE